MLLADLREPINLVATVSAQHMWGMETSILLPMFGGAAIGHVCPFFPQDIADALLKLPPHRGLISSPVHLEVLLRSGVQLPGIKRIFSATSPLSEALACQLEASLNTQVLDIFGSSESGIIANRQTSIESLWNLSNIFELVTKADGFEIRADHLPENVLIPDIVEKTGEGKFRWLGRHQDIVNIAGKRGSFRDLNQRLRNVSGVEDGVIFFPEGRDDHLAALVVAPKLSVTEILNALKPQVDPVFLPRSVYSIDALPRQETGKLASVAVNNLFDELREASKKRA
jgi:acyl-coenzyme A synthetase/AMP-(fatty) acid ligase